MVQIVSEFLQNAQIDGNSKKDKNVPIMVKMDKIAQIGLIWSEIILNWLKWE